MRKLNKEIEFVGDKLDRKNFRAEFHIATYRTKDGSEFDDDDAFAIACWDYRLEQAPVSYIYGDTMEIYYHNSLCVKATLFG